MKQLNFDCPSGLVYRLDALVDGVYFRNRAQLITTILSDWLKEQAAARVGGTMQVIFKDGEHNFQVVTKKGVDIVEGKDKITVEREGNMILIKVNDRLVSGLTSVVETKKKAAG